MSTIAAALAPTSSDSAPEARFAELFYAVEDLLRRIADTDDPSIRHKRAKLREELIALQSELPKLAPHLQPIPAERIGPKTPDEGVDWSQPTIAALTGVALVLSAFQGH